MHAAEQPASSEERWRPPQQFGYYVLDSEVDGGGMGIIYKAYKMPENKPVALKFLVESSQYKRFQREAAAGQLLQHRNFVRYHDTGEIEGHFYIAMDFIEGEPLKKYMRVNLTSDQRLHLFQKIVLAIAYAHEQGIIHRDLKPANILIDMEGEPVILDFGLVKYRQFPDADATALTMSGQILGTPGYMSPEQARGEIDSQDERSDIFCLGIILYEMLAARNPFEGENFLEICYNIAHKTPLSLDKVLPGLPSQLVHICDKALARRKEDRYQNAQEFSDAIDEYLIFRKQAALDYPTQHQLFAIPLKQKPAVSPQAKTAPEATPAATTNPGLSSRKKQRKLICNSCGAFNVQENVICERCGKPIRKTLRMPAQKRENFTQLRENLHQLRDNLTPQEREKASAPTQPVIPIHFEKKEDVAEKTPTAPLKDQSVKLQQNNSPAPTPMPVTKLPITRKTPRKVPLTAPLQRNTPDVVFPDMQNSDDRCLLGALSLPFSMIPIMTAFAVPLYGYLIDIVLGGIASAFVYKKKGGALWGSIVFAIVAFWSLALKYLLQMSPNPFMRDTLANTAACMALSLLLGCTIGLFIKQQTEET